MQLKGTRLGKFKRHSRLDMMRALVAYKNGVPVKEICERYLVYPETLRVYCKFYSIPPRLVMQKRQKPRRIWCLWCGEPVVPHGEHKNYYPKYCGIACRIAYKMDAAKEKGLVGRCEVCHGDIWPRGNRRYCSVKCQEATWQRAAWAREIKRSLSASNYTRRMRPADFYLQWTQERLDRAVRLKEAGLSASKVAERLGGTTKNAVVSKLHRVADRKHKQASRGAPSDLKTHASTSDSSLYARAERSEG